MSRQFNIDKHHLRAFMLYDYRSDLKAIESHRRLSSAFGDNIVPQATVYDWYRRFKDGDESLEDQPRSGRPSDFDEVALRNLVESNPSQSVRELAAQLAMSSTSVYRHLKLIGKVPKLGKWVPHQLSERDRQRRVEAALSLLSISRRKDWLATILTSDEKWVVYDNISRKLQWVDIDEQPQPVAKPNMHPRKVMLSVWWDSEGVVYYELLPTNTTITAEVYCEQLERVSHALQQKRPNRTVTRYLHDNARPHVAKVTREKLLELGWQVLVHPPYSPDLAPSDFHLFNSLSNHMRGKQFENRDQVDATLSDFFASKPVSFYKSGFDKLFARWKQVIHGDGDYIID